MLKGTDKIHQVLHSLFLIEWAALAVFCLLRLALAFAARLRHGALSQYVRLSLASSTYDYSIGEACTHPDPVVRTVRNRTGGYDSSTVSVSETEFIHHDSSTTNGDVRNVGKHCSYVVSCSPHCWQGAPDIMSLDRAFNAQMTLSAGCAHFEILRRSLCNHQWLSAAMCLLYFMHYVALRPL